MVEAQPDVGVCYIRPIPETAPPIQSFADSLLNRKSKVRSPLSLPHSSDCFFRSTARPRTPQQQKGFSFGVHRRSFQFWRECQEWWRSVGVARSLIQLRFLASWTKEDSFSKLQVSPPSYHACYDSFLQLRFLPDLRMMGNVNFPTTASGKHVLWAIHPATGQ